ncbi:hypothetical protein, partial [Bilophila wadsworthia]
PNLPHPSQRLSTLSNPSCRFSPEARGTAFQKIKKQRKPTEYFPVGFPTFNGRALFQKGNHPLTT